MPARISTTQQGGDRHEEGLVVLEVGRQVIKRPVTNKNGFGLEVKHMDINTILKDEDFTTWLKKNFFYFMKKEILIEKYMKYLGKDLESLGKLYAVYKDNQ